MTNLEVCRVGTKYEICEVFARVYRTAILVEKLYPDESRNFNSAVLAYKAALFDWLDNEQCEPVLTPMEAEESLKPFLDYAKEE